MKLSETATNIGSTYSLPHYLEYARTRNKNLFEEIIDRLILDGVAGMNESFRNSISSLSPSKKRMAILSLLDKDRNLFTRIKALIDDRLISNMDHIKDVITMLREYVKVGEVEKKKFGEVMTPLELVKEMLATLPVEVWSNPNLKWLDPANGTGPYPTMVIYRLMNGLKDWEPNEELRYKHIIENMIYVAELQPKNMFLYMCVVDPLDKYDLNIYTGSFLDAGFDRHMKAVWEVDKFDIVMGNPPYNNEVTLSGTSTDIYDEFIIKSDKISNFVLMVTPSKWFSKSDKRILRKLLIEDCRLKIIVTKNKYFDDLNIRGGISYFLTNKEENRLVLFDGEEKNLKEQLDLFGFILKDQKESDVIKSILNKLNNRSSLSTIFNSKGYFGLKTNHKKISKSGSKCYFSGRQKNELNLKLDESNQRHYSYIDNILIKDNRSKKDRWKLITPAAYGFKTKSENTYNQIGKSFISSTGEVCTETYVFFDMDSEKECISLLKYLKTDLVRFLISLKKTKQDVTSKIFDIVPLVDFSQEWNDKKLFEYFKLTEEEIKLIKLK